MISILKIKESIVNVSLGINIISLLICIFAFSKAFFIAVMVINILLGYTMVMMSKLERNAVNIMSGWGNKLMNKYNFIGGQ